MFLADVTETIVNNPAAWTGSSAAFVLGIFLVLMIMVVGPFVGVNIWAIKTIVDNLNARMTETNTVLKEMKDEFMDYLINNSKNGRVK